MSSIKKSFQKLLSPIGTFATVLALFSFLLTAVPAFAGTGLSVTPNFPTPVTVGQTNVAVSLVITNASTADEGVVTLSSITLVPSCGDSNPGCTTADPDVFSVSASGTGNGGTSCTGDSFTITEVNATTGQVSFVRNGGPLTLAFGAACQIDFTVDVLKVPTVDLNGVSAGVQTAQLGGANGTSALGNPASGTGADITTVAKASPTISTIPNPASGTVGDVLNDTATVSGGANPTGNVTFKLFPPSDASCTGPEVFSQIDGSAPYATGPGYTSLVAGTYHWTADYAGDANNNPASSGCAEEPVTIVALSHIIVDKVTDPSADPQSFSFTTTGSGYTGFSLTDAAAPNDQALTAGTYSVAETPVAGWDLESATCSDGSPIGAIGLQAGETVTCTFTNEKDAKIIVVKQTTPDGNQTVFDFTSSYGAPFTLNDGQQNDSGDLDPGTYSVAETPEAGWTMSGATCSDGSPINAISLQAGETVTCTFNNTQNSGTIIVVKDTVPNDQTVFDFDLSYGDGDADLSDGQSDNSGPLTPGTYTVAETANANYTTTSACVSSLGHTETIGNINLNSDETVTCTFTNTLRGGRIEIEKQTTPAGHAQSFGFTGEIVTSLADNGVQGKDVAAGQYTVSETALAGWTLSSIVCNDGQSQVPSTGTGTTATFNVAPGETVRCVFNNTLQSGHLIVQKTTVPAGDTTVFAINASGTGTITGGGAGTVTDATDKNYEVTPGTYSVTETLPSGWTQTSNTCNGVVVDAGETETCVIVNTFAVQYCSPGYWRQSQHFVNWVGYDPDDKFADVFSEPITIMWSAKGKPAPVTDPSLLQALEANGGGINMLARATVGALLNAAALESGYTTDQVKEMFQETNPDGDFQALAEAFTAEHNCPLGSTPYVPPVPPDEEPSLDWDASGNYVVAFNYQGSDYAHDMNLTQDGGGNLTGNGGSPAGAQVYTWVITSGSVVGNVIDFFANYTATADAVTPQTVMHVTGTIAPGGTMSGTWSDNYQGGARAGTWTSTSGTVTALP